MPEASVTIRRGLFMRGTIKNWKQSEGADEKFAVVRKRPGRERIICAIAEKRGFRAVQAADEAPALTARRSAGSVDLVLSDATNRDRYLQKVKS